jgi:hypothetical protein
MSELDPEPPTNAAVTGSRGTSLVASPQSHDSAAPITLYDKVDNIITFLGGMSDSIFKSAVFKGAPAALCDVIALECMARKQTPLQLAQTFHVFDGKLSMRADAILAEFNRLGGEHVIVTRTAEKAAIELQWRKKKTLFELTWDDVKNEPFVYGRDGQIKVNWATPRSRMQLLWARVVSDGVRAVCPRVNSGRYTPEEIADFSDDEPVRRPAQVQVQASLPKNTVTHPPVVVPGSKLAEPAAAVEPTVVKGESSSVAPQVDDAIDAEFTISTTTEVSAKPAASDEPPFDIKPVVDEPKPETDEAKRDRIIGWLTDTKKELNLVKADWIRLLSQYGAGIDSAKKLSTAQLEDFQFSLGPALTQFRTVGNIHKWLDSVLGVAAGGVTPGK